MKKESLLKRIYRNLLRIVPTKLALYIIYFRGYHKLLNLKNPKYWGEKIQWLKLYGGLEELSEYVDKYKVRDYVSKTIGSNYLNELYGVYDSVNDINFEKMPLCYVLKSTNGSGTVIICNGKKKLDIKQVKNTLKKWLKDDYWKEKKEKQYKNVKNRILVEEYLEDESGSLTDYKFYCFDGKVYYYGVFYDRYINKSIDFYDKEGNKLKNVKACNIQNSEKVESFDHRIKEMIEISEKLSKPFSCVRVDLYYVNNKIYFGELTFTDGAGSDPWNPIDFDIEIANKMKLKKIMRDNNND